MSRRPWYKRYPSDFINGTLHLTLVQKGAYSIVLDLIYDRGGPIPDDSRWIARVCGCSTRCWNQIREQLIEAGKIHVANGTIANNRSSKELLSGEKERQKLGENVLKGAEKTNKKMPVSRENNELEEKEPLELERHTRSRPQILEARKKEPPLKGVPPLPDETPDISLPAALDRTAVGAMVNAWNALAAECDLAAVQRVTAARRAKAKARLRDCGGLDGWAEALTKVRDSPFLRGDNDRGWRADFDFLLQESSFTKLLEGKYTVMDRPNPGQAKSGNVASMLRVNELFRKIENGEIRDDHAGDHTAALGYTGPDSGRDRH